MERLEDRMTRLGKLHDVQAMYGQHGFPSRLPVTLSSDPVEQKRQLQHTANTMAVAAVSVKHLPTSGSVCSLPIRSQRIAPPSPNRHMFQTVHRPSTAPAVDSGASAHCFHPKRGKGAKATTGTAAAAKSTPRASRKRTASPEHTASAAAASLPAGDELSSAQQPPTQSAADLADADRPLEELAVEALSTLQGSS